MKAKLLAATAAVLLFATPTVAQDSTGATGSGTSTNSGTNDGSATQLPVPGTSDTSQSDTTGNDATTATGTQNNTSGTDQNTGTNAQTDTTTTGQTGTGTATGTNAQTDTTTTGQTGTGTDMNANTGTTTTTAGTADNQQMIQQLSQVTAAPDFVRFAAISDMFEIQSGEFASSNLKGKMANELAQMIVKDHKESSRQMMDIVQTANLNVQPPTELDQRHQQLLGELKNAAEEPGATTSSTSSASNSNATAGDGVVSTDGQPTVDQVFARQQVQAHEEGVALFQAYSQNGDNPELKAFAEKGLPKLQEHLKMAQDLVKAQDELMQKPQQ